ncbi:glycosyltransferase family 4 protein [Larkinella punicea]|uniref:Glycosyltransferase n=1 Tax=Larkinella punicea TaxID=2315727 RepID=A0A368JHJ7_9BACT|nr:glycosyltransferase family 4 protein [Larkinella punicea]RCR67137.1 glycosyltransferase [Larkinella punicea]
MSRLRQSVTAHAGARDHYQLSLALHEANWLNQLITESYAPDWLYQSLPSYAKKRYCPGLPAAKISLSLPASWKTAKAHALQRDYSFAIDKAISLTALRTAEAAGSNLFLYSYYAFQAFQQAEQAGISHRILFQLHPHPLSVRTILSEEINRLPFASQSIRAEMEFSLADQRLEGLIAEPQLATSCVVASQFTRKTLIENGLVAGQIRVVPYGVDTAAFPQRRKVPTAHPFRIIFVGRMNQRKGLADLLQAVRLLKSHTIEVVLCGRGYIDHNILKEYKDLKIKVHEAIGLSRLVQELQQSHVFVLPSLAEGFAHVILEAMATGLPVITTENTCGPDVIVEGKHGYLVPIRNPERLAVLLDAAITEQNAWFEMGRLAAVQARSFTWARFREGIRAVYQDLVGTN